MTIDELTQNYNTELKEAYKAGFTECVKIIEQTIKNKQIMLKYLFL